LGDSREALWSLVGCYIVKRLPRFSYFLKRLPRFRRTGRELILDVKTLYFKSELVPSFILKRLL